MSNLFYRSAATTSVLPQAPRTKDLPTESRPVVPSFPTRYRSLTNDEHSQIEESAYVYGNAPESYDIATSLGSVLRTPCGQGFLNVYVDKRIWHIPGGIIADESRKPSTVHWLKHLATQQRRTIAVYSVCAEEVEIFREAGFEINKFGEEPVIDLGDINWQGGCFEWVRRQTNYCRRQGLYISEIVAPIEQRAIADELVGVFFDDLKDRVYSQPLQLLEGNFDPRVLGRRRLFVARDRANQRIEGFLVTSPMENGTAWAFETYRKRHDAVRGTIAFLFREAIDRLQAEGAQRVSLCMVPGKGVRADTSNNADARVRWLLNLWYDRLDFVFSASGQDYFKSRFRPRYVDRYICVYPRNSWTSIYSFLKTSGALQINWWNLTRNLASAGLHSFTKRRPEC
jgi:phosphatidylglycerol lysyltransferase